MHTEARSSFYLVAKWASREYNLWLYHGGGVRERSGSGVCEWDCEEADNIDLFSMAQFMAALNRSVHVFELDGVGRASEDNRISGSWSPAPAEFSRPKIRCAKQKFRTSYIHLALMHRECREEWQEAFFRHDKLSSRTHVAVPRALFFFADFKIDDATTSPVSVARAHKECI